MVVRWCNADMVDVLTKSVGIFHILLLTSCIYWTDSQVISPCTDKNDGDPCLLLCQTPDVNQAIGISQSPAYTNGGTCLGGSCFPADSSFNISQVGTTTTLEILSFGKSDNGTWRCEYGTIGTHSIFISWSKLPTSITELSGLTSNATITADLTISVEVGCLYSLQDPTVKLQLMCDGALATSYDMSSSPSTIVCSDSDLSAYICNYTMTSNPPSQTCNSGYTGYSLKAVVSLDGTTKTFEKDLFESSRVSFESLESTSRFESSSKLESTSSNFFVESSTGISPTDISQLNTLDNTVFPTDAADLSSSIYSSDRNHANSPFKTETFDTAAENTNASIGPNSLLSSMGLSHILDSYKTSIELTRRAETIPSFTVTNKNGYKSASSYFYTDHLFSEFTMSLLTSGLYITTPEISSALISALESSFSVKPDEYTTITDTETVFPGITSSEMLFDIVFEGNMTTAVTPISAANVFTHASLSDVISDMLISFNSITISETESPTHKPMETLISSTAMSYSLTSISEGFGFLSSFVITAHSSMKTVLTADLYESMPSSNLVYQNTSMYLQPSENIQTYSQSSSEILLDRNYPISSLISFISTHEEPPQNTNDVFFFQTVSDTSLSNSSMVNQNVLLSRLSSLSNDINSVSDSEYIFSNPSDIVSSNDEGITSNVFGKEDFSETLSYISMKNTTKYISDYERSSFYEQPVSLTHNIFQNPELTSLPIETVIQIHSFRKDEAESTYTEIHSSHTTHLNSSIPDDITKAINASSADALTQSTYIVHSLMLKSSLITKSSSNVEIEYSSIISASFVEKIAKSSYEMTTKLSSLDKFVSDVKGTTTMKYSLSESSKDAIFVSASAGMIGILVLVVLFALLVNFLKNSKYKNDGKKDKTSNDISWSSYLGMQYCNKSFIDHDYSFNGIIHLHLNTSASYSDNYEKNWVTCS